MDEPATGTLTVEEVAERLGGEVLAVFVPDGVRSCTVCGDPCVRRVEGTDQWLHDRCLATWVLRQSIPAPTRRVGAYGRRGGAR